MSSYYCGETLLEELVGEVLQWNGAIVPRRRLPPVLGTRG